MSHSLPETDNQLELPQGVRVLLIDDQEIIGKAIESMFQGEIDIELLHISEPTKAIPAALRFKPTVILQDLVMPDVDGLTLVKFFRAHPDTREIPLIVLSGREEPITKARSFELGANDYIVKLPDRLELLARVRYHSAGYRHLLERNEAYREIEASRKRMAAQIESALRYVHSLLPAPLKPTNSVPIHACWNYLPCTSLGGDTFSYQMIDAENLGMYLLDATGHGLDSALLSVTVMNVLRSRALDADFLDPGMVLHALNLAFPMEQYGDKTFTIWYGIYNIPRREIAWSGGGHPPAILLAPGEPAQMLESNGPIIGIMEWEEFGTLRRSIPVGSRLLVYSDGCHEIHLPDGGEWSFSEFVAEVESNRYQEGPEFLTGLLDKCRNLAGSNCLDDDFTVFLLDFPASHF